MSLRTLGRGDLAGDRLLRYVYLDESGVGNLEKDPYLVVAGVIVHADKQLRAIEAWLKSMLEDYIAPEEKKNFAFHAHQIFHGNGLFRKEIYTQEVRYKILSELLEVVEKFDLPVVMGLTNRTGLRNRFSNLDQGKQNVMAQASCATACAVAVERYMRSFTDEVATLVYENTDNARKSIRDTHNFLKDPSNTEQFKDTMTEWTDFLPFRCIAETAFFAEKSESSILQIADAVVFTLKRKLANAKDCDIFFKQIDPQLIVRAKAFGPFPPNARFRQDDSESGQDFERAMNRPVPNKQSK